MISMKMYTCCNRILIILLLFHVVFSVSAGQYPKEWPDIDKDTESKCVNLSGVYSNSGEEAYTNVDTQIGRSAWLIRSIPRYLGQALLPDLLETHNIDPKWATKIELKTKEKGIIEIVLWKEIEVIFKTQWHQNIDYECKRYFITTKGSLNADSHTLPAMESKAKAGSPR